MRKFLFGLTMLCAFVASAQQTFNNEWIDYAKTYYKFKVGSDGLYRISGATLANAGLGSADASQLQLWRNGVQVPIYTSKTSGLFSAVDYIEFWGQMNDGKPDKEMYRDPSFQYNDKWSLLTDSAAYFLTVNPAGNNLRLQSTANNVAGNSLPAETSFLYTLGKYYRSQLNNGLYYVVESDRMFSSSFDKGEGWTSADIQRNGSLTESLTNLYPAPSAASNATFNIALTGNAYNTRRFKVTINGDSVVGNLLPYMNESVSQGTFNSNLLSSGNATVVISNITDDCGASSCPADRMVVHKFELKYPRQFNFGGASNFEFTLPASNGAYLEISNFNSGGSTPVLYDLTNGQRYDAQVTGGLVKVVLQGSATARNLVLVSEAAANVKTISSLQSRNFVNYNTAATQGDYLIISNSLLFGGAGGTNPVEEYRAYRSSAQGGSYNAKVYLEDQLIDQFGFGIKKNPAGIRNFIMYARANYPVAPKMVFLIGRGVHYVHQRNYESSTNQTVKDNLEKLNLVPTFGYPASDMLLTADLRTSMPLVPLGRLTAVTPAEVSTYLKKVKDYEAAQETASPLVQDKAWMKNIVHVIGASDSTLDGILYPLMESYRLKAQDSLWGAKVTTFRKFSTSSVQKLTDADLTRLMNTGVSLITYYGHSSATTLEFNLDDPGNYNNQGKYPMFFALGCNAGNTFDYNEGRFVTRTYLSDKYVMAPDRGAINFVASTHFGIVHYLDIWNTRAYINFSNSYYQKPIGDIMKKTISEIFSITTLDDFFARCNAEETVLNGDPAVSLTQQEKPDYTVTNEMVTITPTIVSVADQAFKVKARVMNLGRAINRPIVVETKRQYPSGISEVIRRDTIPAPLYSDSVSFNVELDPIRDKGSNKVIVTVDADNTIDEAFESNNSATVDFVVYEEEARPIYPQEFTIVNRADITLKASTANPFGETKQYRMEIDTTSKFNSSFKTTSTITARGGLLEFSPGIGLKSGTVYYWRVGPVDANGSVKNWNASSFVYLPGSDVGYNQSHYDQHQKSVYNSMELDTVSRKTNFATVPHEIFIRNGVYPTTSTQNSFFFGSINGQPTLGPGCNYDEIIFNVLDGRTLKPMENSYTASSGLYNSNASCAADRKYNFMYLYSSSAGRKRAMDFMDQIPVGSYVVARSNSSSTTNTYPNAWKADTALYGSGNSLYHRLFNQGFVDLDSFYKPRAWAFIYKKNDRNSFTPVSALSQDAYDGLTLKATCMGLDSSGSVSSPTFGPAKKWKDLFWDGASTETPSTDFATIGLIGIRNNGTADTLLQNINMLTQQTFDVSSVDAAVYPYVQLFLRNADGQNYTPYQLNYWRVTYNPVPEGALAPNIYLNKKDSVDVGEPIPFSIAFKNVSDAAFDSLKVKFVVTDRNNVQHVLPASRLKPLVINDTVTVRYQIDTKDLVGTNTLFFDVNPDHDQPEQFRFNNFGYLSFYVRGDTLNPVMDVTFDNVHILNRDIVSSKPKIVIKLKDDSKWMPLSDTTVATVQVQFPDANGTLSSLSETRTYRFNSDTLKFIPASGAPGTGNSASIEFSPAFLKDGDYELIVTGKDMSNNAAGPASYRVAFQVINKPMISNMLNYPNPFTTSTAFVFTLTGSEVPQNLRIQVLTITGKIVKEITKAELGPLRIGRNITEYKWTGTDQFGQKLANGVYLYRVITNQDGKSLDKYHSRDDQTDKYFNKGYGKMYLMR